MAGDERSFVRAFLNFTVANCCGLQRNKNVLKSELCFYLFKDIFFILVTCMMFFLFIN